MSGGNTTPVSQTTTPQLSEEQHQLLGLAMPSLRQFGATPLKLPDFSGVAGFDPSQTAGQEMVLGAAPQEQNIVQGAAGANARMTSGELLTPNSNPALQDTINAATRPITQQLLEQVLPTLRGEASTTGNFGSSRQGIAEGLATGRAAQAVGDTAAKVSTAGYNAGLDALGKGVALAPQTAQAQLLPGLATSGVGDIRQQLQQAVLGEKTNKFNLEQILPFLQGSSLAHIATGFPSGSTTSGTVASPNTTMQGLGLGIAGLGALGSLGGSAGIAGLAPLLAAV